MSAAGSCSHLRRNMFYLLFHKEIKLILATLFDGTSNRSPSSRRNTRRLLWACAKRKEVRLSSRRLVSGTELTYILYASAEKSALLFFEEMSSRPTESVVYFWGCDYSPHENHCSGCLQHFYILSYLFKKIRQNNKTV